MKWVTKHHKLQYLELMRLCPDGLTVTEVRRVFDDVSISGIKSMLYNFYRKRYLLDRSKNNDNEYVYSLNKKGIAKIDYMREHGLGKNTDPKDSS